MNLFDKADESRSNVFPGLIIAESLVKCVNDFIGHKAAMTIERTMATREKGKWFILCNKNELYNVCSVVDQVIEAFTREIKECIEAQDCEPYRADRPKMTDHFCSHMNYIANVNPQEEEVITDEDMENYCTTKQPA